jgi:predicted peroxiredoxin
LTEKGVRNETWFPRAATWVAGSEPCDSVRGIDSKSKVLIKSAWGSADPTQASFPFLHANAFAEAGHPVQIFLLGEAVSVMRTPVASSIFPVGWPSLSEALAKAVEHKIPIHV